MVEPFAPFFPFQMANVENLRTALHQLLLSLTVEIELPILPEEEVVEQMLTYADEVIDDILLARSGVISFQNTPEHIQFYEVCSAFFTTIFRQEVTYQSLVLWNTLLSSQELFQTFLDLIYEFLKAELALSELSRSIYEGEKTPEDYYQEQQKLISSSLGKKLLEWRMTG
jgi:hypothetical protein